MRRDDQPDVHENDHRVEGDCTIHNRLFALDGRDGSVAEASWGGLAATAVATTARVVVAAAASAAHARNAHAVSTAALAASITASIVAAIAATAAAGYGRVASSKVAAISDQPSAHLSPVLQRQGPARDSRAKHGDREDAAQPSQYRRRVVESRCLHARSFDAFGDVNVAGLWYDLWVDRPRLYGKGTDAVSPPFPIVVVENREQQLVAKVADRVAEVGEGE